MDDKQQNLKISETIAEFQDEFNELSVEDKEWMIQNGKLALGLICKAVRDRNKKDCDCGDLLGKMLAENPFGILSEVKIERWFAKPCGKFIVKNKFKICTDDSAEMKIINIGSNFQRYFWSIIEEPIDDERVTIYSRKSIVKTNDSNIIALLKPVRVIMEIKEIYFMMLFNTHDVLRNFENIFYAVGNDNAVHSIRFEWILKNEVFGWSVDAFPVQENVAISLKSMIFYHPLQVQ